jgi:hypothetical protein
MAGLRVGKRIDYIIPIGISAVVSTVAGLLLLPGLALAGVGATSSVSVPTAMAVEQIDVPASFTMINTNTPPNQAESNTVTLLQIAPSCGVSGTGANPCATPDPGVFDLGVSATGAASTACAGTVFTISAPNANGIVTLTPSSPVVLAPPGGSPGSDRCTVNFTFDVLKQPAIDAQPGTPGLQTSFNLRAQFVSNPSALTVTTSPSTVITVLPAPDTDGDGLSDGTDNCPSSANPGQENNDGDAEGDDCDADDDNDAVNDVDDACPTVAGAGPDGCPPDVDPPETEITKGPPNRTDNWRVTFKFVSDEAGSTFECKIDKKPFKACESPKQLAVKSGKHRFLVRAIDLAGNVDPSPDRAKFKVVG